MTKRPALLFLAASVALCLVYVSTTARVVGELIPPLDDTFIHFQYARRMAEGHFFSYQAGDGYSSGATSLLWPALLAVGWLVGFREESLYLWALILGTMSLAAAGWYTWRWVTRVSGETTGWIAAAMVLTSGPLCWGSFSGMEVPLFAAAIAAVMEGLGRPDREPGTPAPGGLTWAGVLAAVRPEGALLAGLLALAQVGEGYTATRRIRPASLLWFVPVSLGAVQPVLNLLYTGRLGSASALAKQNPRFEAVSETYLMSFVWDSALWGGYGAHFLGKLALPAFVLFAVGAWTLVLRDVATRRVGPGLLGLTWWVAPMVLLGAVLPIVWHHYRYLQPGLVLFLPIVAIGAAQVDGALASYRRTAQTPIVLGTLAACLAFDGLSWRVLLAKNATDIRGHQVELGRWIAAKLPPEARVATNDIGAITYLGGRRVLDLEGIVSADLLDDALEGEGSTYARLVAMRPDIVAVFPGWFPSTFSAGALTVRRHARLIERTISGGDDLVVATLEPMADVGPSGLVEGERVIDTLDVSDLDDERAHDVIYEDEQPLRGRANTVVAGRYADQPVVDSARRLQGGMSLRVTLTGARRLVGRFGPAEAAARLRVCVDGRDVGIWTLPAIAEGRWSEESFDLPSGGGRVELLPIEVGRAPGGGWHLARLWIVG